MAFFADEGAHEAGVGVGMVGWGHMGGRPRRLGNGGGAEGGDAGGVVPHGGVARVEGERGRPVVVVRGAGFGGGAEAEGVLVWLGLERAGE